MMIRFAAAGLLALVATGWGDTASADDVCRRQNIGGMYEVLGAGLAEPVRVEVKFKSCDLKQILVRFATDMGRGRMMWTSWERGRVERENNGYLEKVSGTWRIGERCALQTFGIINGEKLQMFQAYVTYSPSGSKLLIRGRRCEDRSPVLEQYVIRHTR